MSMSLLEMWFEMYCKACGYERPSTIEDAFDVCELLVSRDTLAASLWLAVGKEVVHELSLRYRDECLQ